MKSGSRGREWEQGVIYGGRGGMDVGGMAFVSVIRKAISILIALVALL